MAAAVVSFHDATLTDGDLRLLGPGQWLNDAVIACAMEAFAHRPDLQQTKEVSEHSAKRERERRMEKENGKKREASASASPFSLQPSASAFSLQLSAFSLRLSLSLNTQSRARSHSL